MLSSVLLAQNLYCPIVCTVICPPLSSYVHISFTSVFLNSIAPTFATAQCASTGLGHKACSYRSDLFQDGWQVQGQTGSSYTPGAPLSSGALRTKEGNKLAEPHWHQSMLSEHRRSPPAPSFSLYTSLTLLSLTHTHTVLLCIM